MAPIFEIIFYLLAAGLIFFGVFNLIKLFFPDEKRQELRRRLQLVKEKKGSSLFLRLARPFLIAMVPFFEQIKMPYYKDRLKRYIISAGLEDEITPDEFIAFKVFMGLFLLVIILVFTKKISPLFDVIVFLLGFFYPELWLRGVRKTFEKDIRRHLPYVLDLLKLTVSAGMDFLAAIQLVIQKSGDNTLTRELDLVLKKIRLGQMRRDALREMAWRIDMPEITSLVSVLVQADELGTSISQALSAQADSLRQDRFLRAEKLGAEASQKLLFPLVFFIFPALFIVVLGPLIIKFIAPLIASILSKG